MNLWIFLVGIVLVGMMTGVAVAAPVAQVTVHVVDEQGQPVEGAHANIVFVLSKPDGMGLGSDTYMAEGLTDSAGYFTGSGETEEIVSVNARKEGYYRSTGGILGNTVNRELNRWEPWNPTVTITLKKKRSPVPMYYKQTDWIKVPVFDTPVGYDLEQGDWVAPYGKGKASHFIFTVHQTQEPARASYTLSFSHSADGIQPYVFDVNEQSSFKWPFEAPTEGYASTMTREKVYRTDGLPQANLKKDEEINYIFRIHKLDEQMNIVSVMYGKIEGEISLITKGSLNFSYYLNPDGTPNLEEDSRRNLFDEVRPPSKTLRQIILERESQSGGQAFQEDTK